LSEEPFVDYYEILQVSPNADSETIERVFRHLARRYHPDNHQGGDAGKFDLLVKAHRVLANPEQRAAFDVRHRKRAALRAELTAEAADGDGFSHDKRLRAHLLSLLYVQRRREPREPGLGNLDLSRMLDCPYELLDFHLWYLRQKGWIELTENGLMAITAQGVDRVEKDRLLLRKDRLLTERAEPDDPEAREAERRQIESLGGPQSPKSHRASG
jgi:curved DNA-binding protein CbpA